LLYAGGWWIDGEEEVRQSGVVELFEIVAGQLNTTQPSLTLYADKPLSRFGNCVVVSLHSLSTLTVPETTCYIGNESAPIQLAQCRLLGSYLFAVTKYYFIFQLAQNK